jgi:hypothetical protein
VSDLQASILKNGVIGLVNVFILEGAHEAHSNAVWGRLARVRHTDAHTSRIEQLSVKPGRALVNAIFKVSRPSLERRDYRHPKSLPNTGSAFPNGYREDQPPISGWVASSRLIDWS